MAMLLLMGFFCFVTTSLDMMELSMVTNPWQKNQFENHSYSQISIGVFLLLMFRFQ